MKNTLHQVISILIVIALKASAIDVSRNNRLLNVFNIVTFPNDPCNSGDNYGSCYTATECQALGGSSLGSCASGFGVCCTMTGNCGSSSSLNNSYFSYFSGDTSPCQFKVCKSESNICQIRLDFDTFVVEQPNTNVASATSDAPAGRTQCLKHQFWITSDAGNSPTVCGTLTGHHMIVTARDDCNTLNHIWTEGTPSYKIRVSQISCTADWRPNTDCLQWYTGTTGYLKSYNYDNSYHFADQNYNICIRTEKGYCSIMFTAVSTTSFQISGYNPTATALTGESCTSDYILISKAGTCPGPDSSSQDRFCGALLADSGPATTATSICTFSQPFMVGVRTDGTEYDVTTPAPTAGNGASKGFYLYYSQTACS